MQAGGAKAQGRRDALGISLAHADVGIEDGRRLGIGGRRA
jgi:hypothetical protein